MYAFGLPERRYLAHDGTSLAYWISRPPPETDTGYTVVLANGIGIARAVWRDFVQALRTRFTLVFWDYRCFYRSEIPADLRHLTLEDHARDIAGILEQESLQRVIMVGWSMGVQVSVESWRFASHRQVGFVLMNGTPGETLDTAFYLPGLRLWVPPLSRYLSHRHPERLRGVFSRVFRKELTLLMRSTRAVTSDVDMPMLEQLLEEYASLDFGVYFLILSSLGLHRPTHLEHIQVPALVLVGASDMFTPPVAGRKLARRLPKAELVQHPRGSHYMLIEYPHDLLAQLEAFFAQRVMNL